MTILNVIEGGPSIFWSIFGAILAGGVAFVIAMLWSILDGENYFPFSIIIAAIVIGILVMIGIIVYPHKVRTKIECTISDDVSLNDIYEKYEIEDKRGDIYTLIEKETEE